LAKGRTSHWNPLVGAFQSSYFVNRELISLFLVEFPQLFDIHHDTDKSGRTALHLAVSGYVTDDGADHSESFLKTLFAGLHPNEPNVDIQDDEGRTSLMLALSGGSKSLRFIELLTSSQPPPDPELTDREGQTIVHHLIQNWRQFETGKDFLRAAELCAQSRFQLGLVSSMPRLDWETMDSRMLNSDPMAFRSFLDEIEYVSTLFDVPTAELFDIHWKKFKSRKEEIFTTI
jgi:hypothetical protein